MSTPERKKRTPKPIETLLTRTDFKDYPGLLEWLTAQGHKHARTPAQEVIYRLKLAQELDQRRGSRGKLKAAEAPTDE